MSMRPIQQVAADLQIPEDLYEPYGRFAAKIDLQALNRFQSLNPLHYILVTATHPTPLGEGKTVTSIGLSMALNKLGRTSIVNLRQSSMGPLFGVKGGGAGGGASCLLPKEESLLHLTGDIHAVTQAHNQIAALMDNSLFHDNPLQIDKEHILFPRVTDINDRFLRKVEVGLGHKQDQYKYTAQFVISAASELMAILALAHGDYQEVVYHDVRKKLRAIAVAYNLSKKAVTAGELRADRAALVILKKALQPNLMQTSEGTPALVHMGPFANIAHGCSSIVADLIAARFAPYIVTEAGFGADLGAEKFIDIKCRTSGMYPSLAVVVTSIRSLKYQSGKYTVQAGQPLPQELTERNLDALAAGAVNLKRHISNLKKFGLPVLVAINRFDSDSSEELQWLQQQAVNDGADGCEIHSAFIDGSAGAEALAKKALTLSQPGLPPRFLYPLEASLQEKIHLLATEIYGAKGVVYSERAKEKLAWCENQGYGRLPVCMAKTPFSFSHDPKLLGSPQDYDFKIDDIHASAGAGFIVAKAGTITTMPGLNAYPIAQWVHMDNHGSIQGLY